MVDFEAPGLLKELADGGTVADIDLIIAAFSPNFDDLMAWRQFAQLKGIAELARRYYNVRMREESPLLSPEMTREFLQSQLTGEEREIFMVIFLEDGLQHGLACRKKDGYAL